MNEQLSPAQAWEAAYRRFETPEQERQKFLKRLKQFGVESWDRNLKICEMFCGRGNGLYIWQDLGFKNIEGLDLSADLVADYKGTAKVQVGDARDLPYEDATFDVIVIQGGLHHLTLMDDLHKTMTEIHRVLKPDGRLVLVEPWWTPFLNIVHKISDLRLSRMAWDKLDALATMTELEHQTYFDWLGRPDEVRNAIGRVVEFEQLNIGWGKIKLIGRRKPEINAPA